MNDLHGIIKGIIANNVVTVEEIKLLRKWINENIVYKQYQLFSDIIIRLEAILEDNKITKYEMFELQSLTQFISKSKIYNTNTLAIQVLKGILQGIIADTRIDKKELESLKEWMEENSYLEGVYPYDSIYSSVEKVLEDGIVTKEEEKDLFDQFSKILNPTQQKSTVSLKNSLYCLSGEFEHGSKYEINELLKKKGAVEKSGVSSKLNYLFVGGIGNAAWSFGSYGAKVAKALELQEKGCDIQIVSEDDLFKKYLK